MRLYYSKILSGREAVLLRYIKKSSCGIISQLLFPFHWNISECRFLYHGKPWEKLICHDFYPVITYQSVNNLMEAGFLWKDKSHTTLSLSALRLLPSPFQRVEIHVLWFRHGRYHRNACPWHCFQFFTSALCFIKLSKEKKQADCHYHKHFPSAYIFTPLNLRIINRRKSGGIFYPRHSQKRRQRAYPYLQFHGPRRLLYGTGKNI